MPNRKQMITIPYWIMQRSTRSLLWNFFYRCTVAPQSDVEMMIAFSVFVASVIQYLNTWKGNITSVRMRRDTK